jgi:SIR2-like domain
MSKSDRFIADLERIIRTQLKSQKVGYLLGAGASYLNGNGYPLASTIWDEIKDDIPHPENDEIQAKLDMEGTEGIEHALDLLDPAGPEPTTHRTAVIDAIAKRFSEIKPSIESHKEFVKRISKRNDGFVPIFTVNYDPLIEFAADEEKLSVVDGFSGFYKSSFDQNNFDLVPSKYYDAPKGRVLRGNNGILHLYKLHGSMGWFSANGAPIRVSLDNQPGDDWRRLMIPPQYRKATETTTQPYSALWTRYRAWLIHGPRQLNRLVCVGYGMRDEHVNDVIESATSRGDFTLIIFARSLADNVFQQWAGKGNVIIVTKDRCSHFGNEGPGHDNLWDFEAVCKEV